MPNGNCPSSSEVIYQKDTPSLLPNQTSASQEGVSNWGEQKALDAFTAKDAENRARVMDDLNATISPDNSGQMPITTADKIGLRQVSKQLQIEFANTALESRLAAEQAAWNAVSGTTVGQSNTFLNAMMGMANKFVNARAKRDQWGLIFAGEEGLTAQNNRMVELSNLAESRIEGMLQTFTGWMNEVQQLVKPYARRAGLSTQEAMQRVGDYANMEHAAERNAMLERRWRMQADEQEAAGNMAEANKLRRQADTLAMYKDTIDPVDAGGSRIMSGGITDAEARMYQQKILDMMNMTHEEMAPLTQGLRDVYSRIQQERIDNGMVAPDVLASFPEFQNFVPYRTVVDNGSGLAADPTIYNPGHFHAIEGTNANVQDAFTTINTFARRAALELGYQDLGRYMVALRDKHRADGIDSGLRVYDYGTVLNRRTSSDPVLSAWANRVLNSNESGGIVVDVSRVADDGSVKWERKLVTFDPQWKDTTHGTNLTGMELANTFSSVSKKATGLGSIMTGATSWYGQMFTRFNPAFAPINMQRDNFERLFNLAGRAYERSDGSIVQGYRLMGSYIANIGQTMNTLAQALRGSLDRNTEMGRYWDEYVRNGLHQQYTRGMNEKRTTLADAISDVEKRQGAYAPRLQDVIARDPKLKGFRQKLANINEDFMLGKALKALDGYNDFFNNVASFNHYVTLRRAGVETSKAAHGALTEMNLYQTGTLVPMLRAVFPFVKPTMQGAAAAARSLGLAPNAKGQFRSNKNGVIAFMGTLAAMSLLGDATRTLMGEDENGVSYFDMIPMAQLQRMLPISMGGGDYVKFNYGFGYAPIAATLAIGYDRVKRGIMTPEDFNVEVASVVARNMSPADFPQFAATQDPFKWIGQFITPSVFKPVVEVMQNTNVFGGDIYTKGSDKKSMAESGRAGTQPMFKQWASGIYGKTGFDIAPESVRHLTNSYSFGPVKWWLESVKQSELPATGIDKNVQQELGPFWTAVGGSMVRGKVANVNRTMFMQEQRKLNERIKKENIPISSTSYGSDSAKREAYQRGVLEDAGWEDTDIEKYLAIERGSSALKQHAKEFRKHLEEDGILDADDTESLKSAYADYFAQQDEDYLEALIAAGLIE